ncbi:hypothetical protein YWS52_10690 [Chitiniphilus shinanonensis]
MDDLFPARPSGFGDIAGALPRCTPLTVFIPPRVLRLAAHRHCPERCREKIMDRL